MAIAGYRAQVKVSGAPVAFTDAATTEEAGRTRYRVSDPARAVWDRSGTITVRRSTDGGSSFETVDADAYRLDRLAGTVTFEAAQPEGAVVTVSGAYLPLSVAAEAREFTWTLSATNADASTVGGGFTRRVQAQRSAAGSLSRWATADRYFETALAAGAPVVLEFYADADAAPVMRAWALVSTAEISAAVDGLVEASVEWEGATDADGRTVTLA